MWVAGMQAPGFNATINLLCGADQVLLISCSISFICEQGVMIMGYRPTVQFPEDYLHAKCSMIKET